MRWKGKLIHTSRQVTTGCRGWEKVTFGSHNSQGQSFRRSLMYMTSRHLHGPVRALVQRSVLADEFRNEDKISCNFPSVCL
jgi:hypothetical protein